jgi:thiosulfate reductase cytochrome b subunit
MTAERDFSSSRTHKLHPLPIRVTHWLNALAIIIMIGSGWNIYNDNPVFGWLRFPALLTIGGDPAVSIKLDGDGGFGGALQWHFAAMWLLVLNGLVYLAYGLASGRFRRKFVPIWPRQVMRQILLALQFKLKHDDIKKYNAVQKLLYVGIILVLILQIVSGLTLWKPVQLSWLAELFSNFQGIRLVHFLGMMAIVLFLFVHVGLALIVPRTIGAMVTGGPKVDDVPPSDFEQLRIASQRGS